MVANGKCSHAGCSCMVTGRAVTRAGKQYCSDHCASAIMSGGSGGCGCGHPECTKESLSG
jgi:hypothetical protein